MANVKKRVNYVGGIRRDGRFFERPAEVREGFAQFTENLYKSDNFVRPNLDGGTFSNVYITAFVMSADGGLSSLEAYFCIVDRYFWK